MILSRLFLLSFLEVSSSGAVLHEVNSRPVDAPSDVDLVAWPAEELRTFATQFSAFHDPKLITALSVKEVV